MRAKIMASVSGLPLCSAAPGNVHKVLELHSLHTCNGYCVFRSPATDRGSSFGQPR